MSQTSGGVFGKVLRWSAWWLLFALFTFGLLSREAPRVGAAVLPAALTFWASKSVHLGGYALLSALVAWLPASPRLRVALWLLLAAHAPATEYLQQFVEGRHPSVADVGIDWAGLCLGLALARLMSGRERREQPPGAA